MRRDSPDVVEIDPWRPLPAEPNLVVETLLPFISAERLARIDTALAGRTRRIVLVLDQTTDPHNAAAVLRSCDAFGVQEVHVIAGDQPFTAPMRVARGTAHWLDIHHHADAAACAQHLHERGYRILVASMEGTVGPSDLRAPGNVAVVFGNEHRGVGVVMRDAADGTYAIPMHGFVESLNVSVAAAITLHSATHGLAGDLAPDDLLQLRARFMRNSVVNGDEIVVEVLARGHDCQRNV